MRGCFPFGEWIALNCRRIFRLRVLFLQHVANCLRFVNVHDGVLPEGAHRLRRCVAGPRQRQVALFF